MGFKTELACKVGFKVAAAAACLYIVHVTAPIGGINNGVAHIRDGWEKSKAYQSLNDKYLAGKIDRQQWVIEAQTTQAKLAWVQLSTRFPKNHKDLAQTIKRTWPAAEAWA